MKHIYLVFLSIIVLLCPYIIQAQCSGNITFTTQAEMDAFDPSCTAYTGNLFVSNSSITDLTPLSNLTIIDGTLRLQNQDDLTGLENLVEVGNLSFYTCEGITNMDVFQNLTQINGDLIINDNDLLTDISGFNAISKITGELYSEGNNNLEYYPFLSLDTLHGSLRFQLSNPTHLTGFNNTTHVEGDISFRFVFFTEKIDMFHALETINGTIRFQENYELTEISSFQNLQKIESFIFFGNGNDITIDPFSNLDTITEGILIINEDLNNLDFFSNVKSIGCVSISFCSKLTDLSGLENISEINGCTDNGVTRFIDIEDNSFLGNCCAIKHLLDGNPVNGEAGTATIQNNACACIDLNTVQNTGTCDYGGPLLELYLSTSFNSFPSPDMWTNKTGWEDMNTTCDIDPCDGIGPIWYGVDCNGNKVRSINLNGNNLEGILRPSIGELLDLEELLLGDNQIKGKIPTEIGNLNKLFRLSLAENQFTGAIPSSFGNLAALRFLYLQNNQLEGPILSTLGNLPLLEQILLYDNQLSSSIPSSFGNLILLVILNLQNNLLTGSIPNQLGNLTNLSVLRLGNNQLTGSIPSSLMNLTALNELGLGNNQLSGSIPTNIGALTNLSFLTFGINNFTGQLPSSLGDLNNLTILNGLDNQFTGCFHTNLNKLCTMAMTPDFSNNSGLPGGGDFSAFCVSGLGSCGSWDCDGAFISIDDNPLPNGLLKMEQYIRSGGTVDAPNVMVRFQARDSILLNPQFEVKQNASFEAIINDCANN